MKYSVFLHEPFGFRPFWTLLGIGLLLAAGLAWLLFRLAPRRKGRPGWQRSSLIRRMQLFFLKRRFLRRADRIEKDFVRGMFDSRETHQRLSREVRLFVQKATGKPASCMVASDFESWPRTRLHDVIRKMYPPEFAFDSDSNVSSIIRESKELISTWI